MGRVARVVFVHARRNASPRARARSPTDARKRAKKEYTIYCLLAETCVVGRGSKVTCLRAQPRGNYFMLGGAGLIVSGGPEEIFCQVMYF